MTITAAQVKAARELLGWSRSQLAGRVGLSATTIAQFETGARRLPFFDASVIAGVFEEAGVEFASDGQPGARMKHDLIKLQFRNAQLRGKITRALHNADETAQREDDKRATLLTKTSGDTVETLADIFENLRGRAIALVDAGIAKREDFPEIG
jgi:transcriptional regulator with XRE-family HTH domain